MVTVIDRKENRVLYSASISCERTLEILDELDKMPALYGVYQDGEGYMPYDHYQKLDEYMFEPVSVTAECHGVRFSPHYMD